MDPETFPIAAVPHEQKIPRAPSRRQFPIIACYFCIEIVAKQHRMTARITITAAKNARASSANCGHTMTTLIVI
jgi:hypothetical protein